MLRPAVFNVAIFCLILIQLGDANQSVMFANTVCSGEEFATAEFLPALRLAIEDVNNEILRNGQQITLCNSYEFESNHTTPVSRHGTSMVFYRNNISYNI